MKTKFKLFIFDLDGTLLDTIEDITFSINKTLNYFDLPEINIYECKNMIGEGMETLCAKAISYSFKKLVKKKVDLDLLPDKEILEEFFKNKNINLKIFTNYMNKNYNENCFNYTKPYEGIIDFLEKVQLIRKIEKINFSILSNKPDVFVKKMVNRYFKKYNFYPIIGGSAKIPLKPSKESLYNLLNYIDDYESIKFNEIVIIGDSKIDVLTAKNSNVYSCFVKWGFGSLKDLEINQIYPDIILEKPHEIINLFQ
ncbi:MAG: HAD family hydrolase [Spirochaetes bacterium]|nr:HAD family hydrolase [Spirochaetota bacterium]